MKPNAGSLASPLWILIVILLAVPVIAQTNGESPGITPMATLSHAQYDTVNVHNLGVRLDIPVLNKQLGTIPFSYSLSMESSLAPTRPHFNADGSVQSAWSTNTTILRGLNSAMPLRISWAVNTHYPCPQGSYTQLYGNFQVTDGTGTFHFFNPYNGFVDSQGCYARTATATTLDSSGYTLTVSFVPNTDLSALFNGTLTFDVYDRAGNHVHSVVKDGDQNAAFDPVAISLTDSNGNAASLSAPKAAGPYTFLDSFGLAAVTDTSQPGPPATETYTYTGGDGQSHSYTVTFQSFALKTVFACPGIFDYGDQNELKVASYPIRVDLPDGTHFGISYEQVPGFPTWGGLPATTSRIASITLPTGGLISYEYTGGTNGVNCVDGSANHIKRTTPDGIWTYDHTPPATGSSISSTLVRDALGNESIYFFSGTYEIERDIYDGPMTNNKLLSKVVTCYGSDSSCAAPAIAVNNMDWSNGVATVTTPNSFAVGQRVTFYNLDKLKFLDGITGTITSATPNQFTVGLAFIVPSNAMPPLPGPDLTGYVEPLPTETDTYTSFGSVWQPAVVADTYNDLGLLTRERRYDIDGGPLNTGSLPISDKTIIYGTYSNGSCSQIGNNIADRPCLITIANGAGNIQSQEADSYDGAGNLLTRRSRISDGVWATHQFTYFANGTLKTMTDPNQVVTTFTNGACNGNLPTSVLVAGLTTTKSWDCNGAALSSQTDANQKSTQYKYDLFWHLTEEDYPDGGQISASYNLSAAPPNITTKRLIDMAGNSVTEKTILDTLGRPTQRINDSDPDGTTYVDLSYDADGHLSSISNPHRAAALSTDGAASTLYDGLGRVTQVTAQDGSVSKIDYSQYPAVTTIDPAGKLRRSRTDGLGRLVEVDEPGGSFSGTLAAGTVPVSGSLKSTVTGGQPATQGTASVNITGNERSVVIDPCADIQPLRGQPPKSCPQTIYDKGTVTITVNGHNDSTGYLSGSNAASVASGLATAINNDSAAFVTASASPGSTVLYLTAKQTGPGGDYSWSLSSISTDTTGNFGPAGSFSASPASGTMGGGSNGTQGTTVWDAGTVSVSVGSFAGQPVPYGSTTSIDVRFTNDSCSACSGTPGGGDRNLFINSISVGGTTILPSNPSVSYVGAPCNATSNGIGVLGCNGDFNVTTTATGQAITISAYGSPDLGVYPTMQLLLNGTLIAQWTVTGTSQNYSVNVPAGDTTAPLLAAALASTLNVPNSPVTASVTSSGINITYKSVGQAGNAAVTVTSIPTNSTLFPGGSFGGTTTLAAGQNASGPGLDHNFYVTLYSYDALGNLVCTEQRGDAANGTGCNADPSFDASSPWRVRRFTYDSLGRLLTAHNPESGAITYTYDANGNLLQKTSPAPNQTGTATQTLSYCYDALNRLTGKAYSAQTCQNGQLPAGSAVASYFYDQSAYNGLTILNGLGRRTGMSDQAGAEGWSYDAVGRPTADQRTTNGIIKKTSYIYNLAGSPNDVIYPSGHQILYFYNTALRATSMSDQTNGTPYVLGTSYSPEGALSSASFGGTFQAKFFYNNRLQPCRTSITSGNVGPLNCADASTTGNVLDLSYNFGLGNGDNGNLISSVNNRDSSRTQSYSYDALNRLATAQTNSTSGTNCFGETFGYDAWGNLLTIGGLSGYSGCLQENLTATANVDNQIGLRGGYDAAGNEMGAGIYDAENRLTSTGTVTYLYDGDGRRVEKSSGILYWYGMGSDVLDETDLTGSTGNASFHEYLYFNGQRVARRDISAPEFYYFTDHLGTTRAIAQSGQTVPCYDADFYPFGGQRQPLSNICPQNYKFTGKERDSESGLDYFGARHYSNSLGRFITPDWAGKAAAVPYAEFADPQSLNLYSYVRNNPLSRTDPTGHYEVNASGCRGRGQAECQRKYDAKVDDFEKQRQKGLKSKDPGARAAAAVFGNRGDKNGVHVGFGNLGADVKGVVDAVSNSGKGRTIDIEVTFNNNLSGKSLQETVAHEGTHVGDDMRFLTSYDFNTGKFNSSLNPYHLQTEFNAYSAGAVIDREHGFGPNDGSKIVNFIYSQPAYQRILFQSVFPNNAQFPQAQQGPPEEQ